VSYRGQHAAAFINSIAEEGDKSEALEYLQRTWDDFINLRIALKRLGYSNQHIDTMVRDGTLGKVY
jgi:hypothetical protein